MSWRELRNFSNTMQLLGYPYQISMDAFRTPNFDLMANVLIWLIKRYDPQFSLPFDTSSESDRVFFVKEVCSYALAKLRVKLAPNKLYSADGYAVQELAKIAKLLVDASHKQEDKNQSDDVSPSKLVEPKNTRQLVSEIINEGAGLSDLLSREKDLKMARLAAIALPMEVQNIEKILGDQIGDLRTDTTKLQEQLKQLEQDRSDLQGKIEKKRQELERARARMKSWQNVKPVHMEEYEKLEGEVQQQYKVYVEKFRNVEWLEHELEQFEAREQQRIEDAERAIVRMQRRIRDQQAKQSEEEDGVDAGFAPLQSRRASRPQGGDVGSDEEGGSDLSSYSRSEENQSDSGGDIPGGLSHGGLSGGKPQQGRGARPAAAPVGGRGGGGGLSDEDDAMEPPPQQGGGQGRDRSGAHRSRKPDVAGPPRRGGRFDDEDGEEGGDVLSDGNGDF